MLEHHYVTAISVAGAAIAVGSIASEIGIAMIPGVSAAAAGTRAVAKEAGKKATKEAAKETMKAVAKSGAQRGAARLLPAGPVTFPPADGKPPPGCPGGLPAERPGS